ncbi:hypothetical protein [Chitiniphilus eburneus]|uniref:Uncharacterized protein n=1 Tax=Chitiniphilus eburneus TaxID=2571148 RepID=A0A4U0Q7V0_9NEIS|nr:hypothetical protein [Chitiniphilus eburneus]TJZ77317.1 hypothetical protein FAZ21_02940 [Chitiniphilus eburneus]
MRGKIDWVVILFGTLFVILGVLSVILKNGNQSLASALEAYAVAMAVPAVILDIFVSFSTGKAAVRGVTIDRFSQPVLFFIRVGMSFVAGIVILLYFL